MGGYYYYWSVLNDGRLKQDISIMGRTWNALTLLLLSGQAIKPSLEVVFMLPKIGMCMI